MNRIKVSSTLKAPPLTKAPAPVMGLTGSASDGGFTDFLSSSRGTDNSLAGGGGGGSDRFVPNPSVFRELSDLETPDDLKGLFRSCRYLARYSGVHKAFVTAMSTFPITDIIVRSPAPPSDSLRQAASGRANGVILGTNDETTIRWHELISRHWKLQEVNQRAATSYYTFSNAVLSVSFPFIKMLKCRKCEHELPANDHHAAWTLMGEGAFVLKCPKCNVTERADVWDRYIDVPEDIRLLVLDVERIYGLYNEFRDETVLYYELEPTFIERLKNPPADPELICTTPQAYLEAALGKSVPGWLAGVSERPLVRLRRDQCYLMRSDTLPPTDTGLAFPEMAASLKEYWLLRLLQKSQEAIASGFIIPMRFVYPESSSKSGNLFEMINVQSYMEVLRRELAKHRKDPNYISAMPFPVAYQSLSGEGKGLNLSQEIRIVMEMMVADLGAPLEFIFGGMSYSGSNVSIKQQEVKFENFRNKLLDMNRWFTDLVSRQMTLATVVIEHSSFKMGDDQQQTQLLLAMQSANAASLKRVHDELGWDHESEKATILREQKWLAQLQTERASADLDLSEHQVIRQTAAQAEGMIRGTERQVHARLELANAVRRDQELYNIVMADPNLAGTIFGPMSPEALNINSQMRMLPDPSLEAPGAEEALMDPDVLDRSSEPNLLDPAQAALKADDLAPMLTATPTTLEDGGEGADLASRITQAFQSLESSEWPRALTEVRSQFGDEIGRQVMANLAQAQMMLMQAPTDLPARRQDFMPA